MADIVPDALRIQLKAYDSTGSGGMMVAYPETLINRVLDYVPDVTQRINDAIGSAGHLTYQVWPNSGTFPPDPQFNVIYLIPASGGGIDKNVYDEYMWMVATSGGTASWEIIGNTRAEIGGFLPYSGTINSTHALVGISGGTVADAGLTFGNGTLTNAATKIAREDGVYVHVSKRITDNTSAYKATGSTFGVVKIGDHIDVTTAGVISVPNAGDGIAGVVYKNDAVTDAPEDAEDVPTVSAVLGYVEGKLTTAFGAQTLTGSAPIVVSGGTVRITSAAASATPTTSGAVKLYNTASNKADGAITPAAVSAGLAGKLGKATTYTANHLLKINAANGTSAVDAGVVAGSASFNTTAAAGSSTLATEAGVSAYVAAASPKPDLAGYTAASSGVMYVVSSGGVLTITSGGLSIKETSWNAGMQEFDDPAGVPTGSAVQEALEVLLHSGDGAAITSPVWLAGANDYGVVKIGSNINVTGDGVISVSSAVAGTNPTAGVVKLYSAINTSTNGAITPAAVSGALTSKADKIVQGDYGVYVISSGGSTTIGGYTATANRLGVVTPWAGDAAVAHIDFDDGEIKVHEADLTGTMGVVNITDTINTAEAAETDVPTASAVADYVAEQISGARLTGYGAIVISGGSVYAKQATASSSGVAYLYNTVNTSTNGAITPAAVSSYLNTFVTGINAVAPLHDNITATGGTIRISSATATQSGAVLIMSGGTFTNAANKVATEGAVFSNCIFYSIV